MKDIANENIAPQAIKAMFAHLTRDSSTQKLMVQNWIRAGVNTVKAKSLDKRRSIILPGVYLDAPKNKKMYQVCTHGMLSFYSIGYWKYQTLKKSLDNASPPKHALTGRKSNRQLEQEVVDSMNEFFQELKEEAEAHAIVSGRSLKAGLAKDVLKLPCFYTQRNVYTKYAYKNGYEVKADRNGSVGKMCDYPIRKFDDEQWPVGSVPKKISSIKTFRRYWEINYPEVKVRPPTQNICAECLKYRNELNAKTVTFQGAQMRIEEERTDPSMDANFIHKADVKINDVFPEFRHV